jgi:two-component system cell cycle sensor histidine kinase/response regulator CckA
VRARSIPLEAAGEVPDVVIGFMRDVSEERTAATALLRSRQQLLEILSQLPDGVLVLGEEGVLYANQAMLDTLETSWPEAQGLTPEEIVHPDDLQECLEAKARAFAGEGHGETMEARISRASGGWTHVAITTLQTLDYQDERALLCQVRDLTAQLRTRRERDQAEAHYRSIFDQSPLGVFVLRPDGRIVDANPSVLGLLGMDSLLDAGRSFFDLVHRRDRDKVAMHAQDLVTGVIPEYARNTRLRAANDTYKPVRMHLSAVASVAGEEPVIVCLVEDTSERMALEQQLRTVARIESIGRLAGGVAHDFNNLVTVITGHAEMLLDELDERDEFRQDITEILEAGERAAALTHQLLAFSRRTVQETSVLDLNEVVQGIHALLTRTLGEDIYFRLELGEAEENIVADRGQLEQVILNLVVNARDAMPRGGTLTVATQKAVIDHEFAAAHPGAVPGEYLRLQVSDTGVGMAPDVLDHIFEPFFTTKPPGVGTGLGLATVYGIIKQSRGYLDVESEVGRGTSFYVYLPAVAEAATPRETRDPPTGYGGSETILLVEDEDAVRSLAQRVLGLQGYRVFTASNGQEGLNLARSLVGKLDLLVTDVVMPILGGRELSEKLQEYQPGVRTLFISGYPDDALLRHGMKKGTVNMLAKPFTAGDFARRVREALDGPAG